MRLLILILVIFAMEVHGQNNLGLRWNFKLEKITTYEYNLIAEASIPDSFSIVSAYGDGG